MPKTTGTSTEAQTKEELLTSIRHQAKEANRQLPRIAAASLRDLAEAYAVLTVAPLPLLADSVAAPLSDDAS
ncbi:hypothetical protein ACFV3N_16700 [Streptomyces bauhiniae]|uniref:hypothetical protein n=1 Tax=Streptomyces bauhiniae TaxID=2340725 RepID=UPI00364A268C